MAHEDAGNYAGKHPDTKINPEIGDVVKEKIEDGEISCATAHSISDDLGVNISEVGVNIDLMEIKLSKCQLGLFGYGEKKKLVKAVENLSPELENEINKLVKDTRISCAECWEIAEKGTFSRFDVANGCESLKIKITPCKLGAF